MNLADAADCSVFKSLKTGGAQLHTHLLRPTQPHSDVTTSEPPVSQQESELARSGCLYAASSTRELNHRLLTDGDVRTETSNSVCFNVVGAIR